MTNAVLKRLKATALFTSRVVLENVAGQAAARALDGGEESINYAKTIDDLKEQFRNGDFVGRQNSLG